MDGIEPKNPNRDQIDRSVGGYQARRSNKRSGDRYQLGATASSIAKRAAVAGLSGGVGKAAQKAVEGAAQAGLARGAERTAKLARARRARKLREQRKKGIVKRKPKKKKMTGIGFWMVAGAALMKDVLDLFLHMTVILSFLIIFVGLAISFMILFYLFYNRVRVDSRKLATVAISGLVELLPVASMLPMATVSLFLIKYFENSKIMKKNKIMKRITAYA